MVTLIIKSFLIFSTSFAIVLSLITSIYFIEMFTWTKDRDFIHRLLIRLSHAGLIGLILYLTLLAPVITINWPTIFAVIIFLVANYAFYQSIFDLSSQYKEFKLYYKHKRNVNGREKVNA